VLDPSFFIPADDRLAGKVTSGAQLMFRTSAGGGLSHVLNGRITLTYPAGIFDTSVTPNATISGPLGLDASRFWARVPSAVNEKDLPSIVPEEPAIGAQPSVAS
jgi:hypothetical protein